MQTLKKQSAKPETETTEKEYDNNLSAVLFDNSEGKKKNEKAPDLRGNIQVNSKKYALSFWLKTSKSGLEFYSGKQDAEPMKEKSAS